MVNLHILLVLGISLYAYWMVIVSTFKVPKPTKTQAKWLDYEVGAIVHFNMQTFNRYMKPGNKISPLTMTCLCQLLCALLNGSVRNF